MFIVAGESLIDLVTSSNGTLDPIPGGAPYNFARALALQGVPTGYMNPFSDDGFGASLSQALAASGARHLGRTSTYPTSLAVVTSDGYGQPHYSFYRDRVADRDIDLATLLAAAPETTTGFHTGGLALVPPDDGLVMAALKHFRAQGALCTVDVNMRMQLAQSMGISRYRDAALAIVSAAHVAKVSDEDLHHLGFPGAPQVACQALLHRGCRLVVLTLGASGAWVISAREQLFQAAEIVSIVDTVGAGDCFFAGFIAALFRAGVQHELRDHAVPAGVLEQALHHASKCAAVNLGLKGCAPPTWEEAEQWRGSVST